ncbi:hypothetical protein GY26_08105, partial [Gammaproteobacteria bacterium MFB021]
MTVSAKVSARSEDLNQAPLIDVDNGTLSLEQPSNVLLKLSPDQVEQVVRQGDDLIVTLSDGQVLRITDFYGYGETATSQLYLLGEDNQLYLADLGVAQSNGLLVADYIPLDDSSGLLALAGDTAGGGGLSAAGIAAIAAGVGVAGAVAAGSGGGGGGGGDAPDDGNDGGDGGNGGDITAPNTPVLSLASDTGAETDDGITNDATVNVGGLEANATWEYSTDGGTSWTTGTGTSFELAEGTYADGDVQVRQTDVAGNVSPVDALGPITVDLSAPVAPTISLANDTGADIADGITNDATVNIDGLEANAAWEYSTDGGTTWTTGAGTSFELGEGTYADGDVQVRQTDVAGNVSPVDALGPITVDLSAPVAPTISLANDTGISLANDTGADIADGITNDATVNIDGLEANATWEYSTDGGTTWTTG